MSQRPSLNALCFQSDKSPSITGVPFQSRDTDRVLDRDPVSAPIAERRQRAIEAEPGACYAGRLDDRFKKSIPNTDKPLTVMRTESGSGISAIVIRG